MDSGRVAPRTDREVQIMPYQAEYQTAILDLILPIQRDEFGSSITLADQPDLLTFWTLDCGSRMESMFAASICRIHGLNGYDINLPSPDNS